MANIWDEIRKLPPTYKKLSPVAKAMMCAAFMDL
jgi:hypothetical protein